MFVTLLAALSVAACSTYRPAPLPVARETLTSPQLTDIASASVNHPLLAPNPVDLSQPLSDLDVARIALISSPELAVVRAGTDVSRAQLFAAGLVPDPQLALSLDRPDGIGLVNALGASLAVDLPALLTRSQRIGAAEDRLDQVRLDVAWTEWLVLNQARVLTRRLAFHRAQCKVATDASDAARKLHRRSRIALESGDARLDDTALLHAAYVDAHDRQLELERRIDTTERELNALLGLAPDARLQLASASPPNSLTQLRLDDLIVDAFVDRLDLRALRSGYAALERDLEAAHKLAFTLPQFSLTRARDTGAIWTGGFGLGLALPLWNRNRGDIEVNTAGREQLRAEYHARMQQVQSDIAATLSALRTLAQAEKHLSEEIPQLNRAAAVVRQALTDGDVSILVYESLRGGLLDKQLRLLFLQQERAEAEVALETAAGRLLWGNQ